MTETPVHNIPQTEMVDAAKALGQAIRDAPTPDAATQVTTTWLNIDGIDGAKYSPPRKVSVSMRYDPDSVGQPWMVHEFRIDDALIDLTPTGGTPE